MKNKIISVIGCGNMGNAFVARFLKIGIPGKNIVVSDRDMGSIKNLKRKYKVNVTDNNKIAVKKADIILICVKPKDIKFLLKEIASFFRKDQIIISIVAGVGLKLIEQIIGRGDIKLVRAMPNTPLKVGKGITAWVTNFKDNKKCEAVVKNLFGSLGQEMFFDDEDKLNIVTAISGSGPAYFFYLTEAIKDAGKSIGLNESQSRFLSNHTFIGAATLFEISKENPKDLRIAVTSKGGTTEAAINNLESSHFKDIVELAIKSAYNRASELSQLADN